MAVSDISSWERQGRAALGRRLRQLRLGSGLKFKEICHRADIEGSTLNYLEAGTRTPSIATLRRIGRAYGVDPAELVDQLLKPEAEPLQAEGAGQK